MSTTAPVDELRDERLAHRGRRGEDAAADRSGGPYTTAPHSHAQVVCPPQEHTRWPTSIWFRAAQPIRSPRDFSQHNAQGLPQ